MMREKSPQPAMASNSSFTTTLPCCALDEGEEKANRNIHQINFPVNSQKTNH
jgi:hypothetical protein